MRRLLPLLTVTLIATSNALHAGEQWINGQDAKLVLGQPDFTTTSSGKSAGELRGPQGVAVDPTTGKIFSVKPQGKAKKKRSNHKAWFQASSATDGETDRVIGFVKNRP